MAKDRAKVIAGIILVIAGMQVFIIQPGFIAILHSALHLSDAWAGYIASAEMFGLAASTIVAALLGQRLPGRAAVAVAAVVLAGANLASTLTVSPTTFLLTRATAGLGAGVLVSIGYSMVGQARHADRAFGYAIMALLSYGAVGLYVLPGLREVVGLTGILLLLATLAVLPALLLPFLPAGAAASVPDGRNDWNEVSTSVAANMALVAITLFFLGQGVVWAYLSLIGTAAGIAEQDVASGLALSQVSGILGAFGMAWLSGRVPQRALLLGGTLASVVPLLAMMGHPGAARYGLSVIIFNGASNLMTPLVMALAAQTGKGNAAVIQRAAALQMIGLAVGPVLSAPLAQYGGFTPVMMLAALLFSCVYPITQFRLHHRGKRPA